MRAKTVNENIDFQRGQAPKDVLSIGKWAVGKTIDYYYYHCILHSRNNYWAKTTAEILENNGNRITLRYFDDGQQKTCVIDTNIELMQENRDKFDEQAKRENEDRQRRYNADPWG